MDTNQLVEHGRARFEHAQSRRVLKEKYQAKLTFAYNGGMWSAGPDLINTLKASLETGQQGLVLLDLYDTPVRVDYQELLAMAQERWQEQMNSWLIEHEELNKNR